MEPPPFPPPPVAQAPTQNGSAGRTPISLDASLDDLIEAGVTVVRITHAEYQRMLAFARSLRVVEGRRAQRRMHRRWKARRHLLAVQRKRQERAEHRQWKYDHPFYSRHPRWAAVFTIAMLLAVVVLYKLAPG